jgi:stearoyl-CoA desaturase (delta-9 desaturase)
MQVELQHVPLADPPDQTVEPPSPTAPVDHVPWPQRIFTVVIVLGPLLVLSVVVASAFGGATLAWRNVAIAAVLYVVIGHGVTIGFHRLFTHRAFEAARPLKIALAIAGSMSFQGSLIGWVAEHRRHHMFTDREGDPHSPVRPASQPFGRARGLFQAHVGWFFEHQSTQREKYASDLLADRDLVLIDRLFVPCCVATLLIPFLLGYAIGGSWGAAFGALLWAGVLRVALLHHVTWSTNSLCHAFGSRPFRTKDVSTNLAPLAVLSMGESWHNAHHAFPNLARHGVDRYQVDSSAVLIRMFERLGWAKHVRWPDAARLNARRTATGLGQSLR